MNLPCPKCGSNVETHESTATCGACGSVFAAGEVKTTPDANPPVDAHVDAVVGGCKLLERVGAGGMGVVYKAQQISLGRIVAIKLLPEALRQDPQIRDRFQREIAILASLNHPNIVNILDGGISDQGAYFVMEYVDGVSLRRIMMTGGVKPAEAMRIIPQLCDALEYAHGRGIVHRDIKPENILIDKSGRVRLLDFGLSRFTKAEEPGLLTRPTQVLGTFEYMAPEQREASRGVDHRADLYSLGVVLYEMLTGELPIGRFDPPSLRNVQIDVRLDEVVLHALEKSPDRRYQKASDIKGEVERISATPPPIVPSHAAAAPAVKGMTLEPAAPLRTELPLTSPEGVLPRPPAGPTGFLSSWHGPAELPTLASWISFGVLTIVGFANGTWFTLAVGVVVLAYALPKFVKAPCKLNQWIGWTTVTVMAIVACANAGEHRGLWLLKLERDAPFLYAAPWIVELLLLPLFVYLTERFRAEFGDFRKAPFWILLGAVAIAGVASGSIFFSLVAGGAILFVDHLISRQENPGRQGILETSAPISKPASSSTHVNPAPTSNPPASDSAFLSAPPVLSYAPPAPKPMNRGPLYTGSAAVDTGALGGPVPLSLWAIWAFGLSILGTVILLTAFISLFLAPR